LAVKARSYEVANILLSILGIFAWIQIAIGLFGLFSSGWIQIAIGLFGLFSSGWGGGSQLEVILTIGLKFLSAISVLSGLVSLALVQMARANVHSAEINWEMLQILRETSRSNRSTASMSTTAPGDVIKEYEGKKIMQELDGVSVGDRKFASVAEAQNWLSREAARPSPV